MCRIRGSRSGRSGRRPRLRALSSAVGLALCVLACSPPADFAARQAEIESLIRNGDLARARERLAEVRASAPRTPDEAKVRVDLALSVGQGQEALLEAEKAVETFPSSHGLRLMLGGQILLLGDAARAKQLAISVPPDAEEYIGGQILLARATLATGDFEGGLAVLDRLTERFPERAEPWAQRAILLAEEKRLDEARASLTRARELVTEDALARAIEVANSRLLAAAGDPDGGVALLEVILQKDPVATDALYAIIDIYETAGRLDEAVKRLERAIAEHDAFAPLDTRLARLYRSQGRTEDAIALLEKRASETGALDVFSALARIYIDEGQPALAAGALQRAVEQAPDQTLLRVQLAELLIEAGELDRARAELATLAARDETTPHAEYVRGRLELAAGENETALARLTAVVSQLDTGYAQFWLAKALETVGRDEDATRRYRMALKRDQSASIAAGLLALGTRRRDWQAIADARAMLLRLDSSEVEHAVGLMQALVELGNYGEVERVASQILQSKPEYANVRALLAAAQRRGGKLAEAQATLDGAPSEVADHPTLVEERGLLLAATGNLAGAVDSLRRRLELEPDSAAAHVGLGQVLLQTGQQQEGLALLERALELDPSNGADALVVRAAFRAKTDPPGAIADLTRYLEIRPDSARAYFMLGVVHEGAKNPEAALRAYRRAAALEDKNFAARNNLAVLLGDRGELDAAVEAAQEAYALASTNPNVLDTLGWLYLKKGLTPRAIGLLERAHGADAKLASAQLHLGMAYKEAGRTADARRLLSELEKRPDIDAEMRAEATRALETLGN